MSMSAPQGTGSSGGRRGRRHRQTPLPVADINITPMVDVMLVLLVIFVVTAPMMNEKINVDLPKAKGGGGASNGPGPLTLLMDAQGRVHLGDVTLEGNDIQTKLPSMLKDFDKKALTIKADRKLPYESVVRVMGILRGSGVEKINLAVDSGGGK